MPIKLPDANDQQGWNELLWRKSISPSSSVILSLDNVRNDVHSLLISNKVTVSKILLYISLRLDTGLAEQGQEQFTISQNVLTWIYSLLLVLDYPLLDDGASTLSKILYFCCVLRARPSIKTEGLLPQINIIYTLITIYFGQREF